jgi:hypothetical protein
VFTTHFASFSTNFEVFTRSASRALGAVNPASVLRYQSTSALAQAARALESSWRECFADLEDIRASGAAILANEAATKFSDAVELVQKADRVFRANRSTSEIARSELGGATLEPLIVLLQNAQEKFKAGDELDGPMRETAEVARVLFGKATPTFFRQPSELNWYRGEVIAKCAEIRELGQATLVFEAIMQALKTASIKFHLELKRVFNVLNLPFGDGNEA